MTLMIQPDADAVILQLGGLLQSAERDAVRQLSFELRRRLQGASEKADAYGAAVGDKDAQECALQSPRPLRQYFQAAAEERVLQTLLTVLDGIAVWQVMGESTSAACRRVCGPSDAPDSAA